MNCKEIREVLSLYMDKELKQDELNTVARHLETCPACRKELESLENTKAMLSSLEELTPPAKFRRELRSKLEMNIQQNREGRWTALIPNLFSRCRRSTLIPLATALILMVVMIPVIANNLKMGSPNPQSTQAAHNAASQSYPAGGGTEKFYSLSQPDYGKSLENSTTTETGKTEGIAPRVGGAAKSAAPTVKGASAEQTQNTLKTKDLAIADTAFTTQSTSSASNKVEDEALTAKSTNELAPAAKSAATEPASASETAPVATSASTADSAPATTAAPTAKSASAADSASAPAKISSRSSSGTNSGQSVKEEAPAETQQKIIKNADVNLMVDQYNQAVEAIKNKTAALGGYVTNESEGVTGQEAVSGRMQVRIPAARFDEFLSGMDSLGKIENRNIYTQDVTEEYVDVESNLKAMRTKEERLLAILNKAGQLSDVLAVENELANTRAQLESLEGRLRYLNNRTEYSTININIRQSVIPTKQITASGLAGVVLRSKEAFIQAINNILRDFGKFIIIFCSSIPYLVVAALVVYIVWRLARKKGL